MTRRISAYFALAGAFSLVQGLDWTAAAAQAPRLAKAVPTNCAPAVLQIGGNQIWIRKQGTGRATVVFEAGFGNDSSVWDGVEGRIRKAGVQTLVYDRAGMGHSTIDAGQPYSLNNDVHILRTVLSRCGVQAPIVLVGHSYGGGIGLAAAARDKRIKGLVLLDAVVPGVWTDHEVEKNLKVMRPQFEQIRKEAPKLAKVAIPWAEAMPQTARELNALQTSETLPIIEIAAEHGQTDPDSARTWRVAQTAFTTGHPSRVFILAEGSSHKVMLDKPDLVVSSILTMLGRVNAGAQR